jgi:hypothetical protein
MIMQLFPAAFSAASAFVIAQALPIDSAVDKYGAMGLLAAVIFWMTTKLSKQLDELTKSIGSMPCTRVQELEKILTERESDKPDKGKGA